MSATSEQTSLPTDESLLNINLYGVDLTVRSGQPWLDKFWRLVTDGTWEDDTLRFVASHVTPQTTVLDIGAWIGPITILASKLGDHVYSVEPDPVAREQLTENAALNAGNVTIFDKAISEEPGELTLYANKELGDSETSALGQEDHQAIRVATMTLSELAGQAPRDKPLFLKIDVEGFEYNLAPALYRLMEERRPLLHLSLHPRILFRSQQAEIGTLRARFKTLHQTLAIVAALRRFGDTKLSGAASSLPITLAIIRLIMRPRKRPKNFAITVEP